MNQGFSVFPGKAAASALRASSECMHEDNGRDGVAAIILMHTQRKAL
jgi:hypothetical protein